MFAQSNASTHNHTHTTKTSRLPKFNFPSSGGYVTCLFHSWAPLMITRCVFWSGCGSVGGWVGMWPRTCRQWCCETSAPVCNTGAAGTTRDANIYQQFCVCVCVCGGFTSLCKSLKGFPPNSHINPLNPELNPICYLLALLGAHHFLHVSRIRVKSLTLRLLMSYIRSTYSWCF